MIQCITADKLYLETHLFIYIKKNSDTNRLVEI